MFKTFDIDENCVKLFINIKNEKYMTLKRIILKISDGKKQKKIDKKIE